MEGLMRLRLISLLPFLLLLLVIANTARGQLTSVKVGHNGFSDEAVFYLARDVGIFKKNGIDLELIYIPGGSLSMQALIGNSLDLLLAGGTPMVYAQLKGADLRMIGGVNNLLPYVLVTRENITSAEQLKGKKVGISRFGSNTDFVVKLAATQLGLNPKSDIQIIQAGGQEARVVALKSGAVDATVLTPDVAFIGRKLGFHALLDFVDKGIEYQHVGIGSRTDYLKSHGDTARRFMRAYLESIRYYFSHRDEAVRKSMQLLKVDDRQVGEISFELRKKTMPTDGKPTVKGMQLVLDAAAEDDPKAKTLTPQQLIDLSFLP
jgi:ABC-type nitrate/sulfonate/bicarbonate transport system substrate-binding protein